MAGVFFISLESTNQPIYPFSPVPPPEVRTPFRPVPILKLPLPRTTTPHTTTPLVPCGAPCRSPPNLGCGRRRNFLLYIVAPRIFRSLAVVIKEPAFRSWQISRYSSFEAYVVGGEVLDGETGWTSPSVSAGGNGGGNGALPLQQSGHGNNNNNLDSGGAGSALRPGGRANFFFGADYAALNKARADQAAARLPTGRVDPKAAAVLGVAGSADVGSRGGVASKAQKLLGVGRREGEEGRGEVLALQDESVRA